MTQEVANYLFLHRELIKILNTTFYGYPDGYFFVPPNSYITDRFEMLLREYLDLESIKNRKLFEYIDKLPLISLRGFRSLSDEFNVTIRLWRSLNESIGQDLAFIDKLLPIDYVIPDNLRLIAFELKDTLGYHEQLKQKLLDQINPKKTAVPVIVDKERSILIVGDISYEIQFNSKPFLFLDMLLKQPGIIIEYKDLAIALELNAYHEGDTSRDIKREVQEVKRSLLDKLKEIGVPQYYITKISIAIISKKQLGYKLNPISL